MIKHTPGPWRKYEDGDFDISIFGSDNHHVCTIYYDHNETADADASLIATAPEMLEFLQQIEICFPKLKEHFEWFDNLEKLIAKAEGKDDE